MHDERPINAKISDKIIEPCEGHFIGVEGDGTGSLFWSGHVKRQSHLRFLGLGHIIAYGCRRNCNRELNMANATVVVNTLQALLYRGLAQVTADASFRVRLRQAHKALEMATGRDIGQDEIGKRLGELRGTAPVPQGTVSRWFRGTIPALETIIGLARAYEVDPGWLAFGQHCQSPAPVWFTPTPPSASGAPAADPPPNVERGQRRAQAAKDVRPRPGHRRSG